MFLMALTLRRNILNVVRNFSDIEIKVREATCSDPWCPPSMLMAEISDMTYKADQLAEVMKVIWKRLNEGGKNWRHVYKSLILLEYLIKTGSENVCTQCKAKIPSLKRLQDFFFIDRHGKDQGRNIRELSTQLLRLLSDNDLFHIERSRALNSKDRLRRTSLRLRKKRKPDNKTEQTPNQKKDVEDDDSQVKNNCSSEADSNKQQTRKPSYSSVVDLSAAAKSLTALHESAASQNQVAQNLTNSHSTTKVGSKSIDFQAETSHCFNPSVNASKFNNNRSNLVVFKPSLLPQVGATESRDASSCTSPNEKFTTAFSTTSNHLDLSKSVDFLGASGNNPTPMQALVFPLQQAANPNVVFDSSHFNSLLKSNTVIPGNPIFNPYLNAMINMQMEKMLAQGWKTFTDSPLGFSSCQNANNCNPFS